MKTKPINAPDAPSTPGTYAQAMAVTDVSEWLVISGQIGADVDGQVPESFDAQAKLIWSNIDAQLRAAGMSRDNLIKVTIYLSDRKYIDGYRAARDAYLDGRQVALTCIIAGIFDEGWLMEIEALAGR